MLQEASSNNKIQSGKKLSKEGKPYLAELNIVRGTKKGFQAKSTWVTKSSRIGQIEHQQNEQVETEVNQTVE